MAATARPSNLRRALAVALVVVAVDQATKLFVVEVLDLRTRLVIPVADPWLNLTMAWNEGINFGLFDFGAAGRWALVALAVAIVAGLLVWVRRTRGWVPALGTGAIVGCALGNVVDRLRFGAVADFINMSCCGIVNPFAFNVADAAIFGGAALLLLTGRGAPAPVRRRR
jgi:signal peptidase II